MQSPDSARTPLRLAALAAAVSMALTAATPAAAEPRHMVLRQVTNLSMGDVEWPRIRMQDGNRLSFVSDGDVLGTGTATAMRQIYMWEEATGEVLQVTNGVDCESYDAARPTDGTNTGSRPEVIAFISTCDLDPARDNSDGNPEVFFWEIESGNFRQLTDTQPPVVNSEPFLSDSSRCLVFSSTGDLDDNHTSNPYYSEDHPGPGYSNADGSQEVFLYGKISGEQGYPHNATFAQISNGPPGTVSSHPVIGGYWYARQCQTTAYQSTHDQIPDDGVDQVGQHIYEYKMPASAVSNLIAAENEDIGLPAGTYKNPHISSASPFARGPFIVFESDADLWNNQSVGNDIFRYRVFHPRMTQYTNVGKDPDGVAGPALPGAIRNPVISDGGGVIGFDSTTEHLTQKRDARIGGSPPYNPDQNPEIIRLKGRHKVWQITRTENCDNGQVSVDDDGRRIVFRSTCDLIPGQNPTGAAQVFIWSLEKQSSPIFNSCSSDGSDGCCKWDKAGSSCYEPVFGNQIDSPPRPNCALRNRCD